MPMMRHSSRLTWTLILLVLLGVVGSAVQGATITLSVYTTFSLKDAQDVNLADGSIVIVVGSKDAVADSMSTYGTNLIAWSTTGDDVLIGWGYVYGNGQFDIGGLEFDSEQVDYLYVRFFDTTDWQVEGYTAWGTSDVYEADVPWWQDWWEQDFAENSDLYATNLNNFVVIPEPGALSYMLVAVAVGGWMRLRQKNKGKRVERMNGG